MQYGHFSKDGKEYIIKKPNTPRPWFNYLFNDLYHALISQTGGGFSYYNDPKSNRILRYDHISTDRPGRYLFLQDKTSKDYWSANWQPLRKKLDFWECRHGLGYTNISSKYNNIEAQVTYLVSRTDPVELWLVKIKNVGRKDKKLKVFPFVEFISGDIELEVCYRNILCLYNEAYYDDKLKGIIAFKHIFKTGQKEKFNFFSASSKISGFDCRKESFLGGYNDIQNPIRVIKGKCGNSFAKGEDMIGALEIDINLPSKKEVEFVVCLGFTYDKEKIAKLLRTYSNVERVKAELETIRKYWEEVIHRIEVNTPDPNFNLMVNLWGKYQLFAIIHSRGTSPFHGAEGGLGYRDTAQDSEGLLSMRLDAALEKIEKLLFYQYNSGHAVSGFSYTEGSWDQNNVAVITGKSDVAVWLPFTIISYVKETGDIDFLKKEFEFHDGGKATVYEHMLRAVRYIYNTRGSHGLPLIFKADWNDAYDHVGIKRKGESVWLCMALCRALKQIEQLANFIKDYQTAREMKEKYEELNKIINDIGWDGEWYLAAFNDDGFKIGSSENKEGKVPLNSQTWAILSEIVPPDRIKKILDKIDNYLDTEYGPALFLPSYTKFNPGIGRVTAFAEGTKENAAVFSHACAFKVVADCLIKRGNKAYETFCKLFPMSPAKANHDHYKVEPYVWAEFIVGPGSKDRFGEGSFTWNTGTTPWMFTAATEWILGARRELEGLLIDPCIPSHWGECSIRRPFRGSIYQIKISNPKHVQSGIKKITIDGKEQSSNLIKPHRDGKIHMVEVTLG